MRPKERAAEARAEVEALVASALSACGGDVDKLAILALDPSARKAGACFHDGARSWSTQGSPHHVAQWCVDSGALGAHLWVVEEPYGLKPTKITERADGTTETEGGATPEDLVRLGRSAGFLEGYLEGYRHKAHNPLARDSRPPTWRPYPVRWRADLGLNRRSTLERTARDETALACWQYARAATKRPLETVHGGACFDEAMAVCMVEAARGIARTVSLLQRDKRTA